ncbi:hypothetical protein B0H13DRAFT_2040936 [Mycena leptocephala]|nr:hypothetical protein B0H13DRAFT_2040936 [Mycena leptocephala]
MDRPSWNDTVRAAFGSCVPCLTCSRTKNTANADGDSDDEYTNTNSSVRGVRRARADELEGLLADAHSRRPPPRTPRHISLWGFDLFGSGRAKRVALEGGDEALHAAAGSSQPAAADAAAPPKKHKKRRESGAGRSESTSSLLARAALEPVPTALADVTEADIERRARGEETDGERRARRKARKEMRRLAAALAEGDGPQDDAEFEGFPGSGLPPHLTIHASPPALYQPIPSPFLHLSGSAHPSADAAQEDDDAADLDGGRTRGWCRAQWAGRVRRGYANGEVAYVGMPPRANRNRKRRNRAAQIKSSARLRPCVPAGYVACVGLLPGPHVHAEEDGKGEEFGAFTHAHAGEEDDFDGTPGGLDSGMGGF